jgi:RsiW-degrading membrane proteinase PrsW (M82 family)
VNKAVPLLIILILLSTTLLLLVAFISSATTTAIPSEFLIAATIVSVVALFGAAFSLYTQKRAKERVEQANLNLKR